MASSLARFFSPPSFPVVPHAFPSPPSLLQTHTSYFPLPLTSNSSTIFTTLRSRSLGIGKDDTSKSTITTTNLEMEQPDEAADEDEVDTAEKRGKSTWPAERWREISGKDDWSGLLDPMDPTLRTELIRYGELAQACYDGFDFDPCSKYCGSCKYNRRHFFESLGMSDSPYAVTRYLYATSNIALPNFLKKSRWPKTWSESANWIGYVAVSDDDSSTRDRLGRRDIAIAWRGTVTRLEWLADLTDYLKPVESAGIPCPDSTVKVESGFVDLYTNKDHMCRFCRYSAREQVLAEVRRLVEFYTSRNEEVSITITGHSLGGALAILSAYDIAEAGVNVGVDGNAVPICVYPFSTPRVGNVRFKERFEEKLGVKALRVVNVHDSVPKVPGFLFNEHVPEALRKVAEVVVPWWVYSHVGVELALDSRSSPFLKETSDPSCFHNLEAHLHLLDGYHGKGKRFVLATARDPALVNKACDFLKDHHLVPPNWRQDHNRGMVRTRDGRWVQQERSRMDDHSEDMHQHLQQLRLRGGGGKDSSSSSSDRDRPAPPP